MSGLREDQISLLQLAEQAASQLTGPDQASWLARLEAAWPDLAKLLEFCRDTQDHVTGLRLCAALGRFWWMCGHTAEGLPWLQTFLSHATADSELRTRVVESAIAIAYARADYSATERWLNEALAFWTARGDRAAEARLVNQLGMVRRAQGRFEEAAGWHERALAIYRDASDKWGEASCLNNLGVVAMFAGDLGRAKEMHERAHALRRHIGDERGIASSLGNLGNVARLSDDLDTALRLHNEVLAMRTRIGDRWGVAGSLVCLSVVQARRGQQAEAQTLLARAEEGFRAVDDALGLCEVAEARALLAGEMGQVSEALRLFEIAESDRERLGTPLPPVYRAEADRVFQRAKARLK